MLIKFFDGVAKSFAPTLPESKPHHFFNPVHSSCARNLVSAMKPHLMKLKLIEPIYAKLVNQLPEEWLYEVKFDGFTAASAARIPQA
jgi:hypothetical protein